MAHEIETMAYVGAKPWHGLGTELQESDGYSIPTVMARSGLDWRVDLVPLVTMGGGVIVDHKAVQRSSDGKVLGVVGPKYHPLQNEQAFAWFQPFLDAREAQLHTAGSLKGGTRVWVLAKISRDPLEIVPGDLVEKFILLSHGHDGSLAVRAGFTPIRVVCQNTLSLAHSVEASKLIRIKHTASIHENLVNIREVMSLANSEFEATAEQYRLLARKEINPSDLRKYVKRVLDIEEKADKGAIKDHAAQEVLSTKMDNIVNEIIRLTHEGRGNDLPGVRGTYWAAYNAVSERLTHHAGKDAGKRLDSLWFGTGALTNAHALEVALAMAS